MTDTTFVLIAVALGVAVLGGLACGVLLLDDWLRRRRRGRHDLDDGAPPEALEAFGVDISMWPSRAPRNGSSYEDVA